MAIGRRHFGGAKAAQTHGAARLHQTPVSGCRHRKELPLKKDHPWAGIPPRSYWLPACCCPVADLLLAGCDRQQQAAPASPSSTAPSPVWSGNSSPPCWPTDPITHHPVIETATAPRVGRPQTARSPLPLPATAARRSTAFCTGTSAAATARSVRAPASAPPPHPPPVSTPHNKAQKSRVPLPVCGPQPAQVRAPS